MKFFAFARRAVTPKPVVYGRRYSVRSFRRFLRHACMTLETEVTIAALVAMWYFVPHCNSIACVIAHN